jgi:hypothetical protein
MEMANRRGIGQLRVSQPQPNCPTSAMIAVAARKVT